MSNRATLKDVLDGEDRRGDHVVVMKPMTGRDMVVVASDDGTMADVLLRLAAAVQSHDFTDANGQPADILDQPYETLQQLLGPWRKQAEEDALPQV